MTIELGFIGDRAREMRALSNADRRASIDDKPNVIGFERFNARARAVQIRNEAKRTSPKGIA